MIGILCEKKSAADNFAKALGGNKGTYNGEQYVIVHARGHLYTYKDPDEMVAPALRDKYKLWKLENLPWVESDFKWERKAVSGVSSMLQNIQTTLSRCDEICIGTDIDPTGEGELLAWEILEGLRLMPRKWSRMVFYDEAPASIQKAFKTRKPIKSMLTDSDYLKAEYRCKWDKLSMQFTRIAYCLTPTHPVLRQGRLKSAMIRIVGDGLAAVKAYKKIPYYQNRFRDENGVVYTNAEEPCFKTKNEVPQKYEQSEVVVDSKEMKRSSPPKLLDLAALSSLMSQKGFKAEHVLRVYQTMYEKQVVSYPRTEDKVVTPEQFNELLPLTDKIAAVVGVDSRLLTHRTPRKTHVKNGGAHGANRPGPNVPSSLADLALLFPSSAPDAKCAALIYEILAKNWLSILGEDYEYELQKGHVKRYPAFKGTASVPKKMGYKAIFSVDDEPDDLNAKGLGTLAKPFVHEGFPPKPPTPTMKWLMKQLEKHDVGTGATRTSTYADVTRPPGGKNKYPLLTDTRGKIGMTQFGEMSYVLLENTHIGDLKITEELMAQMRGVADGTFKDTAGFQKLAEYVREDMDTMKKNAENLGVKEKEKVSGTWNGREVTFSREYGGHRFTDDEVTELLAGHEIRVFNLTNSKGSCYNVKGALAEQEINSHKFVGFKPLGYIEDDGSDKQPRQVDMSEYATGKWRGKDIKFKRKWSNHEFTDDEIAMLLSGKSITFEATSQRTGKPYSVTGKLANQTFKGMKFVGFKPDFK